MGLGRHVGSGNLFVADEPFRLGRLPLMMMMIFALLERVEDFSVEESVSAPCVEALAIAALPRSSRHDEGRLGADHCNPFPQR